MAPAARRISSLSRSALPEVTQHFAIREYDSIHTPEWAAVLGRYQNDSDFIPDFQRILVPAAVDQPGRIGLFREPMDHFAFIVFNVELQPAMWIGPHPFRDGPLEGKFLRAVERRVAVVREQGNCSDQNDLQPKRAPRHAHFSQ